MNSQDLAFNKLSKLKVGALFMEMGTGKTKVALDLINSKINKVDYVLWICPFSIKQEINQERLKWHPDLNITIIGCESIGASDKIFLEILNTVENNRTFIVVDESLKIKNREAKRTERIIKLGEKAKYKLILNGTPVSKNILDLWTQMQFLSPKILNMSYNEFKNTYCEYYVRGKLKGLVKKQHNVPHLISLIKPYIFDSKLEIEPKKNYYDCYYEMNYKESQKYKYIKKDFINKICNYSDIDFFSLSQMLQKQYCSCEEKRFLLNKTIEEIDGKVIIFVKFLNNIPEGALKLTGDVPEKERKIVIDRFEKEEKCLYVTYGCGSFGLNLQFCKNIIFSEHTFDFSVREQAEARIYRIGQNDDVNYYNLWCNSGLEKLIKSSLEKKSRLLDDIKNEIENRGFKEWVKNI